MEVYGGILSGHEWNLYRRDGERGLNKEIHAAINLVNYSQCSVCMVILLSQSTIPSTHAQLMRLALTVNVLHVSLPQFPRLDRLDAAEHSGYFLTSNNTTISSYVYITHAQITR